MPDTEFFISVIAALVLGVTFALGVLFGIVVMKDKQRV